ncbi:hypothetical protein [Bryocella elongata]|uniref:hypothetical protein n=1 Tax=Bryocella elongata TaxID=863522 RepID=UPI0011B06CE4|nr:hypothetical protein [Bryocella elongata]
MLAKARGRRILDTGEDPLGSLGYFHHIFVQAGYPDELSELGWFDEPYVGYNVEGSAAQEEQARVAAIEAIENLFDPDLREKRHEERKVRWEEDRRRILLEWPWKLNSPSGRSEYWRRWREHWFELRWLACLYCCLAALFGWLGDRWTILLTWLLVVVPFTLAMYSIILWRRMSYEVQAFRWRQRVDL